MLKDEFKSRVSKFMTDDEIERYETDFEPAYMEATATDKDTFCSLLRDPDVKAMVRSLSYALTRFSQREEVARRGRNLAEAECNAARLRVDLLESNLRIIQGTCQHSLNNK